MSPQITKANLSKKDASKGRRNNKNAGKRFNKGAKKDKGMFKSVVKDDRRATARESTGPQRKRSGKPSRTP